MSKKLTREQEKAMFAQKGEGKTYRKDYDDDIKLSPQQRYEEDNKPIKNKITIKSRIREKALYRGQKEGEVWDVHVPFKGGGFQNLTFDKKVDAEKYVNKIKSKN